MHHAGNYKPSHEEWMHWAHIVADRLALCIHVYGYSHEKAPHSKLSEHDRQLRNAAVTHTLRRLYRLVDQTDTPTDSLAGVAHHDEQAVDGLTILMQDILEHLPTLSADMQDILQSHWKEAYSSSTARGVFHGPTENGEEGIGSGYPEHGRLPNMIEGLLLRERTTGRRKPRHELIRPAIAHPEGERATLRRWADVNSHFMRRAGQVE